MRITHSLYYFLMEQFYFSGLTMATAVLLIMIYYIFGWVPAKIQIPQLVVWYLPLLVWRQIMQFWLQRFNIRPKLERGLLWAGRLLTITVIPIYFLALVGVLRNRRVTFKTTPKGNARGEEIAEDDLNVFKPHLVLTALILAGMGIGVLRRPHHLGVLRMGRGHRDPAVGLLHPPPMPAAGWRAALGASRAGPA